MRISSSVMVSRQQLWQAGNKKSIDILGRRLPIKQSVVWAGAGPSGSLKMGRLGSRLLLLQCDYRGEPLKGTVVYRSLKFLNSDLQLDLPLISVCQSAKEWFERAGSNLILNLVEDKLPDLGVRPQEIAKIMQLMAVQDPASGKTYAVLALNA